MNIDTNIKKLKEDLQNVQAHRRATLTNINHIEEKIAITRVTYSRQFVEATMAGNTPDKVFTDKWERDAERLQNEFEQAQEIATALAEKEKELQQQLDAAHKAEQAGIYNELAAKRVDLNKRADKLIKQLLGIVTQLEEIGVKQRQAATIGKLGVQTGALRQCWYIKESLLHHFRGTSAKFDEMPITHNKEIALEGDRFAQPIELNEERAHV